MRAVLLISLLVPDVPKKPDVFAPRSVWRPLPRPRRGEWLYHHPEPGETFADYRGGHPVRATQGRVRIYLQPWFTRPPTDPRLLDRMATLLRAWFGREVAILRAGPMPARAYDAKRRQFKIFALAARLIRTLPDDALLVLAVTDRDLGLAGFDYALGWGSLDRRVGVLSTHRLGRDGRARRRALGLALHEATHGLSLKHCVFYPCLMNGANLPAEADRRPMQLCPVCRAKLCWNLGLDPQERYAALVRAYAAVGLSTEAQATQRAARATQRPR